MKDIEDMELDDEIVDEIVKHAKDFDRKIRGASKIPTKSAPL